MMEHRQGQEMGLKKIRERERERERERVSEKKIGSTSTFISCCLK